MILPVVLFSLYKTGFCAVTGDPGKRIRTYFVPNGVQQMNLKSKTILLWDGTLRKNQYALICSKWG